ncbi:MAG: hypothetical protein WBS20_11440 [Lysobacterales bacterium]
MILIITTLLLLVPATAISKGGNGKGGGGGGTDTPAVVVDFGDVFGDLIHILRDETTGQPIFAQRWVEMPEALPGYGWGYCAIAVDALGIPLPFKPYSCDVDTTNAATVEVDYFGRLNGSRVQERNLRMHFNETITNIKQAVRLRLDPTGRLALGFVDPDDPNPDAPGCTLNSDPEFCVWATVDSAMENMALYQRMMKYGHIATDPLEVDLWWHGDPALEIQYHPALSAEDWPKFEFAVPSLLHWLPPYNEVWDNKGDFDRPADCFDDGEPIAPCLFPEPLTSQDFDTSADLLGAAGGKHNFFTVDLVQYLNRFLRITQSTEFAAATLARLPAMYRDCWPEGNADPWTQGEEPPVTVDLTVDLEYGDCFDNDVDSSIPNYYDFTNVQEWFMDFGYSDYTRAIIWDNRKATVSLEATLNIPISVATQSRAPRIQAVDEPSVESDPGAISNIWMTVEQEPLLDWITLVNMDYNPGGVQIHNFVDAASDTLRAIEFFHNYEVPENLYCTYIPDVYCLPPPPPPSPE